MLTIQEDEMVFCMQERLSDDLWERYSERVSTEEVEEAETHLIELWKQDIETFRQSCYLLGHSRAAVAGVEEEILESGYNYLNNIRYLDNIREEST